MIKPGSRSDALVATYDIFPTVLAVAGAPPPPPGLVIDGMDLSAVLFNGDPVAHRCIMFYNRPHASDAANYTNLAAIRCGDFKVYWWVEARNAPRGLVGGFQPEGRPAVFNLATDVTESTPLSFSDKAYAPAVKEAVEARAAHLATIEIVPDQNARGTDPSLAICGAPDSKKAYPQWPNCSLTPQYWKVPICGSAHTWWCNQTSAGTCPESCKPAPRPPPLGPPLPTVNYRGCFYDHGVVNGMNQTCDLPHVIHGHCGEGPHARKGHESWGGTLEGCNARCQQFKYFGVQFGEGCFCGDSFGSQGKVADSMCNVTCPSKKAELCGGPNLNSVWAVKKDYLASSSR